MEPLKSRLQSSRYIWILSMIIFAGVAMSMIFSTCYMNTSITQEEDAQTRRNQYREQGETLADASDYLTAEVRYYAVTGQMEHFYNYWYEIYESRQRETAIENFESTNPPQEEKALLETAKEYSDLLVETEMYSMKMVLTAMNVSKEDYPQDENMRAYIEKVMAYEWPEETAGLSPEEMREKAIAILYDENYEAYKAEIMTPIEEFQSTMNNRLDGEVESRKRNTKIATAIQIILAVISIGAIGFILSLMNSLYVIPLKKYTQEIKDADYLRETGESDDGALQILDAKIVPFGAKELVLFAESFNHLIDCFFQELCQRKNAQESMRRARNEAELANQAKSIFLAQMTHELRTPLNAVDGYTYMLERSNLNAEQKKYVRNIRYSSGGLLELINQILDFSKIESGRFELEQIDFELRKIEKEIRGVMENQAEKKGLYLHMELDDAIPEVLVGDPLRIRQLLLNLIGNAVKFTESGGITVRMILETQKKAECTLRFDVIDTGIGVSKDSREIIFQPFMQSDSSVTRKYGGTGLGLPICSQIIALAGTQNHRLHLRSEEGKGSDFYFRMDFPISSKERLKKTAIAITEIDLSGKKLLVVDDNDVNIQVETEMIQMCHAKVRAAASGERAIQILQNETDIDLILMDIRMPDMDGYETTQRIRRIPGYKEIPILALTADAMPAVREKASQAGMNDCLLKPIRQSQLFARLSHYLLGVDQQSMEEDTDANVLFDQEHCLRQLGGNRQAMAAIVESFLSLHRSDEEILKNYLEQGCYKEAEILVHTLKGVTGNLSCMPLSRSCGKLQKELLEKKYEEWQHFVSLWQPTLQVLDTYLLSQAEAPQQKKQMHSVTKMQAESNKRELVANIIALCNQYDTEAITMAERELEYLRKYLTKEQAANLKRCCLQYDFEGMKECLIELAERS
ncbi:hybrid sensor histidine kinase/response regulator [Hespellia stercorisuis]|uniref:Circadian input-output histidine kinase CikA n=1 Tax=Hespellia stercorisuis DSM 15480 TaxID=1121950 RepID=A0A1M6JZ38_9FIRM|nr:hybrid sensor histidine kinase/response regulator [Hespellia stercorisuis]SHJ51973.1 hypothetical protein SAMN02745243_00787 [Hespellia stercorisuis DSM 15480]